MWRENQPCCRVIRTDCLTFNARHAATLVLLLQVEFLSTTAGFLAHALEARRCHFLKLASMPDTSNAARCASALPVCAAFLADHVFHRDEATEDTAGQVVNRASAPTLHHVRL